MNPCEERFESLRHDMVKRQLLGRDIRSRRVLDAFDKVPRHKFVEESMRDNAYEDSPLSIGSGQTISQPYMVALMVQLLEPVKGDKVLEIGTGSGYETAILAELGADVYSMERIAGLAEKAKTALDESGYKNISIKIGDGTLGWEECAPFDKIIVTASSKDIPRPLLKQLKKEGRLVAPIGPRYSQSLMLLEKDREGNISERSVCGCVFVPLVGKHGWGEEDARKDN